VLLAAGPATAQRVPEPRTRTYYVAADTVSWDYAPSGRNLITGAPFGAREETWVASGPARIGRVYLKSVYRAYTDSTFSQRVERPDEWRHLGILGPVLRAVVGDTLRVVFRNRTPYPASLHPHGVFYAKDSEGAPYADGTGGADKADDAVPPGGIHVYLWPVPARAGPGPGDPSSIVWLYHSHVSEPRDSNAGLIGPIIVTARDEARADATPRDVGREFVALFKIFDENMSPYLAENVRRYAEGQMPTGEEDAEAFAESNLMHTINGYVYGNLPGLDMRLGERVRWYVVDLGNEADLHTAHWHGNTGLLSGHRTDVVELLPGTMAEFDMVPDDPGTWLFHCHVDDHIMAGMQALYRVHAAAGGATAGR